MLPERAALALGAALGGLAAALPGMRRRVVDAHLSAAFPEETGAWRRSTAARAYRHLGRELALLARVAVRGPKLLRGRVTVTGLENVRQALAEGSGAVVVSGHLGNWEIGAHVLTSLGVPVYAVVKPLANARVDRRLTRLRERLGVRVVETSAAPAAVARALAEGGLAAFVADQDAHESGVFVPFFGRPASTARGPALLAVRAGAPLFLGVALADDERPGRYRGRLTPVEVERAGRLDADVRRLTEAFTAELEREVRAHPSQYFWHHRRWKTRPPREGTQEPPSGAPV